MRNFAQVNGVVTRLPRYYKEKIFTKLERAILAQQSVEIGDEQYYQEIDRLTKYHDDPYHYYDEVFTHSHDAIKSKVNQLNKL